MVLESRTAGAVSGRQLGVQLVFLGQRSRDLRSFEVMTRKVLVYTPELLPYSETFIKEQLQAYRTWSGVLVGHRRLANGLSLEGLDVRLLLGDPPNRSEDLFWWLRRLFGVVSQTELRLLAAESARLFHAHFGTVAVDVWPLASALNLPMVVTLHGYDINIDSRWWEKGYGGSRRRSYPRKLLLLAREPRVNFVAVSNAVRRRAIEYGIPSEKISVCYIGVDTSRFKPGGLPITQRHHRVVFVGRLVEKKGVSYLIEAFGAVRRNIPGAELIIVGDGPLRAQLENQARGVHANAKFIGALNSAQVKAQLDQARLLCLPSVTAKNGDAEGFGLVVLEAQASGVPVITSARGGAKEGVVEGKTGYTFRERDAKTLASLIERVLGDDSLLDGMSRNATDYVRSTFDIKLHTDKLEQLYDSFG